MTEYSKQRIGSNILGGRKILSGLHKNLNYNYGYPAAETSAEAERRDSCEQSFLLLMML